MVPLILIIDDSLTIRKIFEVSLRREGYEVKTFADAVALFEWLRTPEARIPDLMFVDVGLPRMDGYTLIQRLRARSAFAQTIFVMISARRGVLDRLKGRLVGARLYLTKPIRTQEMRGVVQEYLGLPLSKVGNMPQGPDVEVERTLIYGGQR